MIATQDAAFEIIIRADKNGVLSWLMAAADGTSVTYEDVSVMLRRVRAKVQETPDARVLTMSEIAPPAPVLPEGWTETKDGYNVDIIDGVSETSRAYVHADGRERVAPCGPAGEVTAMTVAVLGAA